LFNEVLILIRDEIKAGKTPAELCEFGDNKICELAKTHFEDEPKMSRGVAFPTCISVNEVACHYSPYPEEQKPLKEGDIVRIDLGVQIDGYPAVVAYTVVVQAEKTPIKGRVADLVHAAKLMIETATRCMISEKKNNDIPPLLEKIAAAYGATPCDGVLSHRLKQYIIDGNECILMKPSPERRVEDTKFEAGQVWTIDVLLTTGKGKLCEGNARCCVYKRNMEQQYKLKLKASQSVLHDINSRFQTFPFTLRALDARTGRLGISECLKHELVIPYPVLYEKPGETVVHFKTTVFILKGVELATGLELSQEFITEKKCEDPDVLAVLKVGEKAKSTGEKVDIPPATVPEAAVPEKKEE